MLHDHSLKDCATKETVLGMESSTEAPFDAVPIQSMHAAAANMRSRSYQHGATHLQGWRPGGLRLTLDDHR